VETKREELVRAEENGILLFMLRVSN